MQFLAKNNFFFSTKTFVSIKTLFQSLEETFNNIKPLSWSELKQQGTDIGILGSVSTLKKTCNYLLSLLHNKTCFYFRIWKYLILKMYWFFLLQSNTGLLKLMFNGNLYVCVAERNFVSLAGRRTDYGVPQGSKVGPLL